MINGCKDLNFKMLYTRLSFFESLQGKDLPAKDISGTSDPYVRVTLLPDKKHRLETKIKRRTLNPRWNETLYFEGERISFFFVEYPITDQIRETTKRDLQRKEFTIAFK